MAVRRHDVGSILSNGSEKNCFICTERLKQMWQNVKNHGIWVKGIREVLYYSCNFSVSLKLFQNKKIKTNNKTLGLLKTFLNLHMYSYI